MRRINPLSIILLLLNISSAIGQTETTQTTKKGFPLSKLTVEPAIGINPMPMSDLLLSNLVQWNVNKRINIVSRSAVSFNTAFARNFNYIHTDYSYTIRQTVGVGTSFYTKRSSHTLSLMAGVKYDDSKETLNNPDFEKASMASRSISPDSGLMYNVKMGKKKYFFSYRMYFPLFPYPFKTIDLNAADGNMANLSLEFGFGIRLK
jgi:hypothetical protein